MHSTERILTAFLLALQLYSCNRDFTVSTWPYFRANMTADAPPWWEMAQQTKSRWRLVCITHTYSHLRTYSCSGSIPVALSLIDENVNSRHSVCLSSSHQRSSTFLHRKCPKQFMQETCCTTLLFSVRTYVHFCAKKCACLQGCLCACMHLHDTQLAYTHIVSWIWVQV